MALLNDCGSPAYWLWHPTYWLATYLLTVAPYLLTGNLLIDCGGPTFWLWHRTYWMWHLNDCGSPSYWLWQPCLLTVAALLTDCGSPTYWLWHPYLLTVAALLTDCGSTTYWLWQPYLLTVAALTDCGSPTYWLWQPYFTLILNFTLAGCSSCMKSICNSTVVTTSATYCDIKKLCTLHTNCIYVFCTILRINNNCFPERYWPVILCTGRGKCLHWGRNIIYKHNLHKFQEFYIWVSMHRKSILYKEPTRCNFGSIVY